MPLEFPTIAEQVLAEFRTRPEGRSLSLIATQRGATVTRQRFPNAHILYTFDDDTAIRTTGAGRNHTAETLLP